MTARTPRPWDLFLWLGCLVTFLVVVLVGVVWSVIA